MSELGRETDTDADSARRVSLTTHEARVYARVLLGESNREIAENLACTVKNVEYHMTKILRKFGEPSRAGLVARFGIAPPVRSQRRASTEMPWLRLVRGG